MKKFISLVLILIAFYTISFFTVEKASAAGTCTLTLDNPKEVTTEDKKVDISINAGTAINNGTEYFVTINNIPVGRLVDPKRGPRQAVKFTATNKVIQLTKVGPTGLLDPPDFTNPNLVTGVIDNYDSTFKSTFPDGGLGIAVTTIKRAIWGFGAEIPGEVLSECSFPVKRVANPNQCYIDAFKKSTTPTPVSSSNPLQACRLICDSNFTDPTGLGACYNQCQDTCIQQKCGTLIDPTDLATCTPQCNISSVTPLPTQSVAQITSLTSEDEIFIRVNNLLGPVKRQIVGFTIGSIQDEIYRVVLKRGDDKGEDVSDVAQHRRSYTDITSGNLKLPRLEPGTYDLEIRSFNELSIGEGNYCKYPLIIVAPGQTGGGIDTTFYNSSYLRHLCENRSTDPNKPTYVCKTAIGEITVSPTGFIQSLFTLLLSIAGGVALLIFMASGYQLMRTRGDPEKVKEQRERITAAIVGLLFIMFSLVILQIIGVDILQIPSFRP